MARLRRGRDDCRRCGAPLGLSPKKGLCAGCVPYLKCKGCGKIAGAGQALEERLCADCGPVRMFCSQGKRCEAMRYHGPFFDGRKSLKNLRLCAVHFERYGVGRLHEEA